MYTQVQARVATVAGLQQGYVVCPPEQRFLLLFTFLKRNKEKKVMVFLNSCMSVRFHNELFNYIDLATSCIHGKMKQPARMAAYYEFCEAKVRSFYLFIYSFIYLIVCLFICRFSTLYQFLGFVGTYFVAGDDYFLHKRKNNR